LVPGDQIQIQSARSSIRAIIQPDDTLRPGLVSMAHAFGDLPNDDDVLRHGSNVGRLLSADQLQPYTGQPLMSNIPVAIRPLVLDR
jgi:anaerobic selenocysteine-containing dehydrogenase